MSANSASDGTVYRAPETPRTAPASRGLQVGQHRERDGEQRPEEDRLQR